MTRTDLVVIGGGPAGAAIAALAARRGVETLLIEKDRFPRDKVCGEFLSAEGCAVLLRLGLLPTLIEKGAMPMEACLLADAKGRAVTSPLPDLPGAGRTAWGISRAVLDAVLLNHAASCGATVREQTVAIRPRLEDGRVTGVVTRKAQGTGGDETIGAGLVIAADGRRSVLQRALHPRIGDPLTTSPKSWFGFKAHFPDRTQGLGKRIELFVFEGGYAGLGPVEGGRLNLALIARVDALKACGNSPQRLFEERMLNNPLLKERLGKRPTLLGVEDDRPPALQRAQARLTRRDFPGRRRRDHRPLQRRRDVERPSWRGTRPSLRHRDSGFGRSQRRRGARLVFGLARRLRPGDPAYASHRQDLPAPAPRRTRDGPLTPPPRRALAAESRRGDTNGGRMRGPPWERAPRRNG